MFLQESIPDTSRYMVLGYSITFIVMALYVLSLYIRNRNLNQDLSMLEDMDKSEMSEAGSAKRTGKKPAGSAKTRK